MRVYEYLANITDFGIFLYKIVQFFTVVIGQRMNSIKTIWSHCREVMIFHLKTPGANVVNKF